MEALLRAPGDGDAIKQLDEKRIRRWRPAYARANGWYRRFRAIFNQNLLQLYILLNHAREIRSERPRLAPHLDIRVDPRR